MSQVTRLKTYIITLILDQNAIGAIGTEHTHIFKGDIVRASYCQGEVVAGIAGGVMKLYQAAVPVFSTESNIVSGTTATDLVQLDLFVVDAVADLEDDRTGEPSIVQGNSGVAKVGKIRVNSTDGIYTTHGGSHIKGFGCIVMDITIGSPIRIFCPSLSL